MKRGSPEPRNPDTAALRASVERLSILAIPFGAQLIYRRYPPARKLTPRERAEAKKLRDQLLERRDSVLHRAGALTWHVGWLFQLHGYRSNYANDLTVMFDDGRAMTNLLGAIRDSLYVFDDIVLNSVSLLDYLAQYLACALAGQGVPRWDKLVNLVQRKDGPSVFGAEVAQMVTQLDQAWVRRLVDHRNYIAHQTASQAGGARTLHPGALTTTLSVNLPPSSHALLKAMGQSPVTTDLLSGAEHIAVTCLRASVELLAAASTTHKIQPGFVPMSF